MKKSILVLCAAVLLLSGCSANDELVENNSSESTSSTSTVSSVIETSSSSTSSNTITSSDTSSTNTDESSSNIVESSDTESSSEEPSIVLTEDYVLSNSIGSLTTRYGNTWYDVDSIYVSFVERWEDKPDEAIVADAYSDMIDVLSKSDESLLSFTWVDKKGSVKAICMVSNFLGKINLSEILWFNDYERLNDN